MPQTDYQILPHHGRRLVLVVDDEQVNRELLGMMLGDLYDVIYAENGEEALEQIRKHQKTLSLILLDVLMPVMDGFEVLQWLKADESLRRIPVIVLTTERSYELKSLQLGAADFIKKPYDMPEIVQARVERIIALHESTYIIQNTENDPLTGLLNQEFFFQYADRYDLYHPDTPTDAVSLDIIRFHVFNELYGHDAGDRLLRRIGGAVRDYAATDGGITCRREADSFLIYWPHRESYDEVLEYLRRELKDETRSETIHFRLGIYPEGDKTVDVRRRFDYAKLASDSVRGSFTDTVATYDAELHQQQLFGQRLMEDMDAALEGRQFKVYYQPKYNVAGEKPVLSSAEALVRWIHPELGFISPGAFIPLFEENGLISKLDRYVWREAARQTRAWRDRFGFTLPVSVNVSRVDLFSPDLVSEFRKLVRENDLKPEDLLLEITESAYTDNFDQILSTVTELRNAGFRIEMDDFGTGYSSLTALAQLPIDVLKLDMGFIRNAQAGEKNMQILRLLIQLNRNLSIHVVAEGVETAEQLNLLKDMGCDTIQGYYFSPPVPPEKFESYLEERKRNADD